MTERQALAFALAESRKAAQEPAARTAHKADVTRSSRHSAAGDSSTRSQQALSTKSQQAQRAAGGPYRETLRAAGATTPAPAHLSKGSAGSDTESFAGASARRDSGSGHCTHSGAPSSLSLRKRKLDSEDADVSSSSQSYGRAGTVQIVKVEQVAGAAERDKDGWSDTSRQSHTTSALNGCIRRVRRALVREDCALWMFISPYVYVYVICYD